jgi:leucyl aminopeptidase
MSESEVSTAPVVGDTAEAPVAEAESSSSPKKAIAPDEVYTLKVNGKEVKVPKSKLEMYAQLGLASDEKFKEAKRMREDADKILSTAKTEKSAIKSLMAAGYSKQEARQIIEEELLKEYEYEDLSPEEKKRREMEEELKKYKSKEEQEKAEREHAAKAREEAEYFKKLDDELAEAIKSSNLPKHPVFGKFALQYMASSASQDLDISAKDAMKLVEQDFLGVVQEVLSGLDAKTLKSWLGDKTLRSLREDAVSELKSKEPPFAKAKDTPAKQAKPVDEDDDEKPQIIKSKGFFKATRFGS